MPALVYLKDSANQSWLLGVTDNGAETTTPILASGVSSVQLQDTVLAQNWSMTVATDGSLHIAPIGGVGAANIPVVSPSGFLYAIVVMDQAIATIVINSPCTYPFLNVINDLALRLSDPGQVFWTQAELAVYIVESLRTFNALTEIWNTEFAFTAIAGEIWFNLGLMSTSPRFRTLTDAYLYTVMEYHLLEPASGGNWTGTSQFTITDLSGALQRRRDEVIQLTGCNLGSQTLISSISGYKTTMPDTVLEAWRARFVPASDEPYTMSREDSRAFDAFEPGHLQASGTPSAYDVYTGPPNTLIVDQAPNTAGSYDVITLQSGPSFNPPAANLLGVPDDWSWVIKWGALADVLSKDSEATDRERAKYALQRFNEGIKIMNASNWLLSATINNVPVDTPSVKEMDAFLPEWENDAAAWPSVVTAGMDYCAPCPVAAGNVGVSLNLVGNAPIPVGLQDCVLVSRDVYDAILDYAQVLASFKMGGEEFAATADLEKNFYLVAKANTARRDKLAIFADLLRMEGRKQEITQPR